MSDRGAWPDDLARAGPPETRVREAAFLDSIHAAGNDMLLIVDRGTTPVAYAAFNASLPDMVQVGGVFTPPPHRGRGFARRVVAAARSRDRATMNLAREPFVHGRDCRKPGRMTGEIAALRGRIDELVKGLSQIRTLSALAFSECQSSVADPQGSLRTLGRIAQRCLDIDAAAEHKTE